MTNTLKSTPPAPRFRQAAIPTCGHANNANNFSYEKTPLTYNLVRTPDLAAQPAPFVLSLSKDAPPRAPKHPFRELPPMPHCHPVRCGSGESFSQYDSATAVGIMGMPTATKKRALATNKFPLQLREDLPYNSHKPCGGPNTHDYSKTRRQRQRPCSCPPTTACHSVTISGQLAQCQKCLTFRLRKHVFS